MLTSILLWSYRIKRPSKNYSALFCWYFRPTPGFPMSDTGLGQLLIE